MKIQGKHFIITGGASGLGAATAECLVARGAYVTLVDMNVEAGQAQAEKLGTAVDFVAIDVTNEIEIAQFFKQTLQQHGVMWF